MSDETGASWSRRTFLARLGRAGLGVGALLIGCQDDPGPLARRLDAGDAGVADLADMRRTAQEMGVDAADLQAMIEALPIAKSPFVQLVGPGSARFRFETFDDLPRSVRLEGGAGASFEQMARRDPVELDYEWPNDPNFLRRVPHPDVRGTNQLYTATFDGLEAGRRYEWVVEVLDGRELRGSFFLDAPREESFTVGWTADTSFPVNVEIAEAMAQQSPDLVLHGGDIQYFTSPFDTWNGFFHAYEPLMAAAAIQFCPGNHEYEMFDEFDLQYRRLFEGQGDPGGALDYHATTFGGVRWIGINSEIGLTETDSLQLRWLQTELEAVRDDDALRFAVVYFHRPLLAFSDIPNPAPRATMHPIFRDMGVPLVLAGHEHNYQRFELEGVTYIVDGGSGALPYSPDAELWKVERDHPEDLSLRKATSASHGFTLLDVHPDDSIDIRRLDRDGTLEDEVSISIA